MCNDQPILIVGCGSIGRRHARNLRALGVESIAVVDPCQERMTPLVDEMGVQAFTDYDDALRQVRPACVMVCSTPAFHVEQALAAVDAGAHLFVEKPLSDRLDGIDELIARVDAANLVAQVGYNLRFHPVMVEIKSLLDGGAIGRVFYGRFEFAQYLPDWRPRRSG